MTSKDFLLIGDAIVEGVRSGCKNLFDNQNAEVEGVQARLIYNRVLPSTITSFAQKLRYTHDGFNDKEWSEKPYRNNAS